MIFEDDLTLPFILFCKLKAVVGGYCGYVGYLTSLESRVEFPALYMVEFACFSGGSV